MLVIEGPDNVGKTTLAKRICERLGARYSHMSRPPVGFDFFGGYKDMIRQKTVDGITPLVVQDRFHFGGIAYHENVLPLHRLEIVSSWVRAVGGLIVLVHASNIESYTSHLRRNPKTEMFDEDHLVTAAIRFNHLVPYADICIDITVPHSDFIVYCGESGVSRICKEWKERLDAIW